MENVINRILLSECCNCQKISYNCNMQYRNNISAIEELASSENGVFTTAQAARLDVPRDALSHAARSGRIERICKGAYRVSGAPRHELDELMAIWKLTSPDKFTYERVASFDGVAVGGTTAAWIHGIGDYWLTPYRLYAPTRVNTRNKSASFVKRAIGGVDVEWKRGVPVTRVERTLFDLSKDGEEPSLLADALRDAFRRYSNSPDLNYNRFAELFGDESAESLLELAGIRKVDGVREMAATLEDGYDVVRVGHTGMSGFTGA